ncbi:MAG: hypothetical protein ABIK15_14260 [Pseudomonadota bacterium]
MIQYIPKINTIILCLLIQLPTAAFSLEYQVGAMLDQQLTLENNYFNSTSGNFNQSDPFHIITISPNLHVSEGNLFSLYLLADLTWDHTWNEENTDELSAEFANAYVSLRKFDLISDIGIQSFRLGRGYIMAGNEPGITAQYQFTRKLSGKLEAAEIIHTSPILSTTIDYQIGFLEKLSIFGAWFHDNDNGFADMLNYQDQVLLNRWLYSRNRTLWLLDQTDLLNFSKSEGNLFWYGLSGDIFLGDFFLSGIMILETGSGTVTLEYPHRDWEFTVSSYLIDMDLTYTMNNSFSAGTFLFITGGTDARQKNFNTFIAPMPQNNRTAIFFSSRFSNQIEENFLSKGGIYWAGVIAPGIKIQYDPSENWQTAFTLATFFPEDKPAAERNWYGWEADFDVSYTIQNNYTLFCESGWFQHGNFYEYQGKTPDPATKFTIGINAFF